MDKSKIISKYMSELGKKGGATTAAKYGREHYQKMRAKSAGRKKVIVESDIQTT